MKTPTSLEGKGKVLWRKPWLSCDVKGEYEFSHQMTGKGGQSRQRQQLTGYMEVRKSMAFGITRKKKCLFCAEAGCLGG